MNLNIFSKKTLSTAQLRLACLGDAVRATHRVGTDIGTSGQERQANYIIQKAKVFERYVRGDDDE